MMCCSAHVRRHDLLWENTLRDSLLWDEILSIAHCCD